MSEDKKALIINLIESVNDLGQEINSYREFPRHYGCDNGTLKEVEIRLLHKIGESGELNSKDLSRLLSRTKGSVSVMVNRLIDEGYIAKAVDSSDNRKHILTLTELGKMVYEEHDAEISRYYAWLADCLKEFSPGDIDKCNKLIKAIKDYWTK